MPARAHPSAIGRASGSGTLRHNMAHLSLEDVLVERQLLDVIFDGAVAHVPDFPVDLLQGMQEVGVLIKRYHVTILDVLLYTVEYFLRRVNPTDM